MLKDTQLLVVVSVPSNSLLATAAALQEGPRALALDVMVAMVLLIPLPHLVLGPRCRGAGLRVAFSTTMAQKWGH